LKKRTKKLLFCSVSTGRIRRANQWSKSFLVLFFKKELLSCCADVSVSTRSTTPLRSRTGGRDARLEIRTAGFRTQSRHTASLISAGDMPRAKAEPTGRGTMRDLAA
jgi:hypothetical protein